MSKFLRQTCILERAVRNDSGEPARDTYGEALYEAPVTLRCRRERTTRDVLTASGSVLRSSSTYYIDETQLIRPDDKIDGHVVLTVEEYTNEHGGTEGFACHA